MPRKDNDEVFTFRIDRRVLAEIEQAAKSVGLSIAEYIRKSVALRPLGSILDTPQYNLMITTPYFQYGKLTTWSENPCIFNKYEVRYAQVCQ